MVQYARIFMAFTIIVLLLTGCSSGESSAPSLQQSSKVTVSGTIDNSATLLANATFFDRIFANLSPVRRAIAAAPSITSIFAISPDGTIVESTKKGQSFKFDLPRNNSYIVVMLNETSIVGIYKVDSVTDLDSLPIGNDTEDFDLGLISLATGTATGSSNALQSLDLSVDLATAIGAMDNGFMRYATVDADGNGTQDNTEGKQYRLFIGYQMEAGTFNEIKSAWSNTSSLSYRGYTFYVGFHPGELLSTPTLSWNEATLHSPVPIDGGNDKGGPGTNPFVDEDLRMMTFFGMPAATNPPTPPTGTYTVNIPRIADGETQTFTFHNVKSQPIDADFNNVYVPQIKLTTNGDGKVTLIEWKWWKRLNDGKWVEPNSNELAAVMDRYDDLNMGLSGNDCNENNLIVHVPYTSTGSVAYLDYTCSPTIFSVTYVNKAGDDYRFYWQ